MARFVLHPAAIFLAVQALLILPYELDVEVVMAFVDGGRWLVLR